MTIDERVDRLTTNLESLAGTVNTLAASVVAHDDQIESLIKVDEKTQEKISALAEQVANTEKQWQAYINTLPRH